MASPWSPPAWMKTTGKDFGGKLKDEYRHIWANYYCKFIEHTNMKEFNVGVICSKRRSKAWDSCLYTAEEERDFVKNYLGPALEKHNLLDKNLSFGIIIDMLVERAKQF